MKLTALAVVILAIGIVVGFTFGGSVFEAEAKPPPPGPQPVEEQNLDASGFIAVHEQGTANVAGTVDVGNLPAIQDVNVVSTLSQGGRLIELGTQAIPAVGHYQSPFVDVSDCQRVTLMATGTAFETNIHNVQMSPDGTIAIGANLIVEELGGAGGGSSSWHNLEITMPFMRFRASNNNSLIGTSITAWIWCAP